MSENKNLVWVNCTKGICVLAVLFIHTVSYYGYSIPNVANFIHPFYVNAFFLISGYLLFRKQLSTTIIEKATTIFLSTDGKKYMQNTVFKLIIPSVIFSIGEYIPGCVLRGRSIDIGEFFIKTFGGCTYWFVSALVVAESIIFLLLIPRRKNMMFYVLFGLSGKYR